MNIDKILNLLKHSCCEIVDEHELCELLKLKQHIVIKVGFDPTTERLHLGHVVLLRKLRLFQEFGYKVSFLIGDFTAMIGDPSGRSDTRKQITRDIIIKNFKTYKDQVFKILDPNLTLLYFNSSWLSSLNVNSFIKLMSSTTVSRLIERNDFKTRYLTNKPIYMHEFIYPLLQAYDSVFMNADIEFGGVDQKFNFLLARNLQKKFGCSAQVSIMAPILTGIDGKNKMSKSLQNCINIDDDFYDMFCKVMSIPDSIVKDYYVFLGFVSLNDYDEFISSFSNFMDAKFDLAIKVVSLFYNSSMAENAKLKFINYFSKRNIFDDIDVKYFYVSSENIYLSDFLFKFNFISSNSEFKRLVKSCSIEVNSVIIEDRNFILLLGTCYCIRIGKRLVLKFILKY